MIKYLKMNRNLLMLRKFFRLRNTDRYFSSNVEPKETEPIKFFNTPAATKRVRPVIKKIDTNMPWYQPYSVVGSIAVFLLYFCVLREENDLDLEFDKTLYDRIKGLEKQQLLQSYRFNKETGKPVEDIEKRLREIEEEESRQAEIVE